MGKDKNKDENRQSNANLLRMARHMFCYGFYTLDDFANDPNFNSRTDDDRGIQFLK